MRLGIIHRDISPANILMSFEGEVKLMDFGIARASGRSQQTNVDALKRKLSYMSPELVRGTALDARSDVFGVGICLYEMVTGKRLFAAQDDITTLKLVSNASVPDTSALQDSAPKELADIIMRALAREHEDRWPTAGEMAQALTAYVAKGHATYGPKDISELMHTWFAADMESEQRALQELITASQNLQLMEQRRRFFASPHGAAAAAKAEAARKLNSKRPITSPGLSKTHPGQQLPSVEVAVSDDEPTKFITRPTLNQGQDQGTLRFAAPAADRKSTRLNSSHNSESRMPSSA
jgi:serine/threonine protein kinase